MGRVPSRVAIRGSVITCSRNNERLILSSYLSSSLLSSSATTYRPFVLLPFQPAVAQPRTGPLIALARIFFFSSFFPPSFPRFVFPVYYFLCPLSRQHFVVDGEQLINFTPAFAFAAPSSASPFAPWKRKIRISVGQVRRGKRRPAAEGSNSRRLSNLLTASYK